MFVPFSSKKPIRKNLSWARRTRCFTTIPSFWECVLCVLFLHYCIYTIGQRKVNTYVFSIIGKWWWNISFSKLWKDFFWSVFWWERYEHGDFASASFSFSSLVRTFSDIFDYFNKNTSFSMPLLRCINLRVPKINCRCDWWIWKLIACGL